MTLTEFLLARIAEDEALARMVDRKVEEFHGHTGSVVEPGEDGGRWVNHITYPTSRVLAECAVKRRIVEQCEEMCERDRMDAGTGYWEEAADASLAAVRALASVYAAHPDYRQEWTFT